VSNSMLCVRTGSSLAINILIGLSIVSCRFDPPAVNYNLKSETLPCNCLRHSQRSLQTSYKFPLNLRGGVAQKRDSSKKPSRRTISLKRRKGNVAPTSSVKTHNTQSPPLIVALVPITASADSLAAQNSLLTACMIQNDSNIDNSIYLEPPLDDDGFSRTALHRTVKLPPHCTQGTATRVTFIAVSGTDPNELLDAAKVTFPYWCPLTCAKCTITMTRIV
jgi:hypothetical protein